jgi:ribose/xylose/arabinose/galactoside ABC-type transport system permease subunit
MKASERSTSTSSTSAEATTAEIEVRLTVKEVLDRFGIVLVLILMMITLTILSPEYFLTRENLTNVAQQTSTIALLALGEFLVILTSGIDLSVGWVMTLGTVCIAKAYLAGWPPLALVAAALASGLFCGLLNGWGVTKLRLPHPFIPTLGMLYIAKGASNLLWAFQPVMGLPYLIRLAGAGQIRVFQIGEEWFFIPVSLLIVVFFYIAFWIFLTRTRTGRHIYAVGGNPQAALYAGINVDRILTMAYVLCGGLAGVEAIILAGRTGTGTPNHGLRGWELDAIAAVIIGGSSFFGGRGTVVGTFVGVLIMGFLSNGLNLLNVSVFWQQVLIGSIIVLASFIDVLRRRAARL